MRYAITEGGAAYMSVFEALVLMISFATLVVIVIDQNK
ncbi:putative holin-like toxin [Virgibacillus salidurans]